MRRQWLKNCGRGKEKGSVKLKDAIDELQEAKKNRGAASGIFAFEKNCAPRGEVGDFLRVGDDFFVTIDEQALENGEPLLFLEAAYKISRVMIATASRKEQAQELDLERVDAEVSYLVDLTGRFSDIITKVRTISSNSKAIEETAEEMMKDMKSRLGSITRMIQGTRTSAADEAQGSHAVGS